VDTAAGAAPADFRPGTQGQDLVVGDRVRTDATGTALITYFEGTTAEVGPSSVVTLERSSTGRDGPPEQLTLLQLAGEVVYRLLRALRPGALVEIRTPSATGTVRGSILRVTVFADGGTRVEVYGGAAEVAAGGITVAVYPGTFTDVAPGQPPAPPAPLNLLPPQPPFPLTPPPAPAAAGPPGGPAPPPAAPGAPGPPPPAPSAPPPPPPTVTAAGRLVEPLATCVEPAGGGGFVAVFGARNDGPQPVTLPRGPENYFTPDPRDRGQPEAFPPGQQAAVARVGSPGPAVVWHLGRGAATLTANSARCPAPP
jgi:FecR protein